MTGGRSSPKTGRALDIDVEDAQLNSVSLDYVHNDVRYQYSQNLVDENQDLFRNDIESGVSTDAVNKLSVDKVDLEETTNNDVRRNFLSLTRLADQEDLISADGSVKVGDLCSGKGLVPLNANKYLSRFL